MQKISLTALARVQLEQARTASSGRNAHTVYGGHERILRQTLVSIAAGRELSEHDSPGEATIYVLGGRVRLVCGDDSWEASAGDMLFVPDSRHSLEATEDSNVLLTVAVRNQAVLQGS